MQLLVFFFFLMLFMPQVFQGPRAALLLLVLIVTFRNNIKVSLNSEVRTMWLLTYIVAIYAFLIGAIRGNVGLLPCTPFYIVWPLLFLYFIIRCNTIIEISILLKTIIFGGLIVAIFNFILIVNAYMLNIGILNSIGEVLLCRFNIQDGFSEYFSPSGNHLAYFVYFFVALLLLNPKYLRIEKKYLYLGILISIIDILLTNRRALWLVIFLLPVIIILTFCQLPYHKKELFRVGAVFMLSGIVVAVILLNFLNMEYVTNELMSSFDFSGAAESNLERTLQGKSLWNDFIERPILGGGIGMVSAYIRTPEGPWAYEMTYNYTLAMVGIVGFFIYTIATGWIFIRSIKLSKKNIGIASLLIPQIMGLAAVLIISASNPYIGTFDFVWAIYLPVATINAIWNEQRKAKACIRVS